MVSQKEIAQALEITQSAVSRALQGHRSISPEMRQKVHDAAKRMGYHLNVHVSTLMSNVRTGKKLTDKGEIGLLINAPSQEAWHRVEGFRLFHQGMLQRGHELGFHIDPFFLQDPNMRSSRIDQILQARGIDGIILAPPGHNKTIPDLQWERYTTVDASVGWEEKDFNRACCDQLQNYMTAFNELQRLGYKRIGTVFDGLFVQGSRLKTRWHMGYLVCQNDLPKKDRIPVFASKQLPPQAAFPEKEDEIQCAEFRTWFLKWHPEVILTLAGYEKRWIDSMKLRVPEDVGMACLAQHADKSFAGIDEKIEILGATALEQVAAQIALNQFGFPSCPKVMMIAGQWRDGITVQNKKTSG